MEQKSYKSGDEKLTIVGQLMRGSVHVRGLAKELGINHMNASRRLRELSDENVADFRAEGKNKVYFLKETNEAKSYAFMAESYRLVQLLKRYPGLRKIVDYMQKDGRVKMALIFGSYAKGNAKEESDIDIYVESSDRKLKEDIELLDSRASVKLGGYDRESPVIMEIEKNHVIIKGAEEFYEKNKLFG